VFSPRRNVVLSLIIFKPELAVIKISEKCMSLGVFPMSYFLNSISSVILTWRLNKLWPEEY
jgi:hypothetical protein